MTKTIEDKLRERCKELEERIKEMNKDLVSVSEVANQTRTEFNMNPIVNPSTGKVEIYGAVSIIANNGSVQPMLWKAIVEDDGTYERIYMEEKNSTVVS